MNNVGFCLQIRARRLQRVILARGRCEYEGSSVLFAGSRASAHAAISRGCCPRLTHTLIPCSAMRQSLSPNHCLNEIRGLCERNFIPSCTTTFIFVHSWKTTVPSFSPPVPYPNLPLFSNVYTHTSMTLRWDSIAERWSCWSKKNDNNVGRESAFDENN